MGHRTLQQVFILIIVLCGAQLAWSETSYRPSFSNIEFAQPIHFFAVDGSDVLIQPGEYGVGATEGGLQLIPAEGNKNDAILIDAEALPHEEEIAVPQALSIPGENEDWHYVVLLLSDNLKPASTCNKLESLSVQGDDFLQVARPSLLLFS
jgi:hypothetical protein